MGEFKAQILAILLVLGVFGLLNSRYQSLFTDIWNRVESDVSEKVS